MGRSSVAALLGTCVALATPASALGASAEVIEQGTEPHRAELAFVAGAPESNHLTVSIAGEDSSYYDLQLLDTAAAIAPGAGCSGGGAPGVAVHCKVHKPYPGDHYTCFKGCYYTPGTRWELSLRFSLGDGGSSFDSSAIPEYGARDPLQSWAPALPIPVTVIPGAGDDTVLTGDGPDTVEASAGDDTVRGGKGNDVFRGGPAADGGDDVDLESGIDTLDYAKRTVGVRIDPNGLADDGAPGEGDDLSGSEIVVGGLGADTLVSASKEGDAWYESSLSGGPGEDTIRGGAGSDRITGGLGSDELAGEGGDDVIGDDGFSGEFATYGVKGPSGDDVASGGEGKDTIATSGGDDRVSGDAGKDTIRLGAGNDRADAGEQGDLLFGEDGEDTITGGDGEDRISGDAGRDALYGDAGADRIVVGTLPYGAWEGPRFLHQPGALESQPDRVDCGTGHGDSAMLGAGDAAKHCDQTPHATMLEALSFTQAAYLPAYFSVVLRRPGIATLSGPGLKRTELRSRKRDFYSGGIAVVPVGRTLARLERDGQVTVRATIVFRAKGGAEQTLTRAVRLEGDVGVSSHHTA